MEKSILRRFFENLTDIGGKVLQELDKTEDKTNVDRSVSLSAIYEAIWGQVIGMDDWYGMTDIYVSDDGSTMFAVLNRNGKLYKAPINFEDNSYVLGELQEVKIQFENVSRTVLITRSEGKYDRFFMVAATATINRDGEIDSIDLFDDLISRANESEEFPYATIFHAGEALKVGEIDWVERYEGILVASGKFDDSELAQSMARSLDENPDYWGNSISYWPLERAELWDVGDGITIPVYRKGKFEEISFLPEEYACSLFTSAETTKQEERMAVSREKLLEALLTITDGDEDKANKFAEAVVGVDRTIQDKALVVRGESDDADKDDIEQDDEEAPVVDEVPEDTSAEDDVENEEEEEDGGDDKDRSTNEIEIDDELVAEIARVAVSSEEFSQVAERVTALEKAVKLATDSANEMRSTYLQRIKKQEERIKALEALDEEKQKTWLEDLPRSTSKTRITHRPSSTAVDEEAPSFAELADSTIADMNL